MQFPELTEEEEKALYPEKEIEEGEKAEEQEEEAAPEEPEAKEGPKEEPKPEVKAEVKEPEPDAGAYARMRWENAQLKRQLEEREAREAEAAKKPIPAKEENYEGHVEGRIETVEERLARLEKEDNDRKAAEKEQEEISGAIQELNMYGSEYAKTAPEYNEAANYLKGMIATGIKVSNPHLSPEELAKRTVKTFLGYAGAAVKNGKNPAQYLHTVAQEYGYKKAEAKEVKEEPKDNFKKIAENKKKSSGMVGAGGAGGMPETTKQHAAKMPLAEFSRMNEAEMEKLMYG